MAAARATARGTAHHRGWGRLLTLASLLLAIFFGVWGLRGISTSSSIADSDSARHGLNGAFVLDMFRHWKMAHPVQYGYWYYSRLPALSLPYHPPLFPVFEALIFSIFGVSPFGARLAVAIAATVAVLLMIRLLRKSHGSPLLALMVTASFFALPTVQRLSNTVMLEIPALVFVLAAFLFLVPDEAILQTRRSLWFAIFAAAAIWTKQTLFLLPLPFLYVLVSGRWNLIRRSYFWIDTFLVGASGIGLAMLARELQWNGINQSWARKSALQHLVHNWNFYLHYGLPGLVLVGLCLLSYRLPGGRDDFTKDRLYIAWLLATVLILLPAPAYSPRYMFFSIPPVLVLLYNGLRRVGGLLSPQYRWVVAAAVCLLHMAYGLVNAHVVYLRGPAEVANILHNGGQRRLLYCGDRTNGAFIFAVRTNDPTLSTIVIRGDKLPEGTFDPEQLRGFVSRYGIDAVVLERTDRPQAWDELSSEILPFLSFERVLSLTDSDQMSGSLLVYRVPNPSKVPESSLPVPISVLGRDVELRF
jgi:4-amino-4-deoxy-L-arabinose transferase-like glycosyltransferase